MKLSSRGMFSFACPHLHRDVAAMQFYPGFDQNRKCGEKYTAMCIFKTSMNTCGNLLFFPYTPIIFELQGVK